MANAFLNAGATSLAAANWSDATGIVNSATLYVQSGTQTVTGGLTPSLTEGVINFDILSGFSGTIGSSAGSLAMETRAASASQTAQIPRVRYWASGGGFSYTPQGSGGASDNCFYFQLAGSGFSNITGTGTITRYEVDSGRGYVAPTIDSVDTYRWTISGGTVTIDGVSGSNEIHSLTISGGQVLLKRGIQGGTVAENSIEEGLNVYGGQVTIDAFGETISTAIVAGSAQVRVVNCGTITYLAAFGGELDFSNLQRPLTITKLTASPAVTIRPSPLLTISEYFPIGAGAEGLT